MYLGQRKSTTWVSVVCSVWHDWRAENKGGKKCSHRFLAASVTEMDKIPEGVFSNRYTPGKRAHVQQNIPLGYGLVPRFVHAQSERASHWLKTDTPCQQVRANFQPPSTEGHFQTWCYTVEALFKMVVLSVCIDENSGNPRGYFTRWKRNNATIPRGWGERKRQRT